MALSLLFSLSTCFADELGAKDYFKRANEERKNADLESALADYNKAIELENNYGPFYLIRGACHFERREWDEAIADFRKANELGPFSQRGVPLFIWAARTLRGDKKNATIELKKTVDAEIAQEIKKTPTPFPSSATNHLDASASVFQNGLPRKHFEPSQTTGEWLLTTEKFLIGRIKESAFFSMDPPPAYKDSQARFPYRPANTQSCDALFYAALKRLARGDRDIATDYLRRCATADGPSDLLEREFARTELDALQKK